MGRDTIRRGVIRHPFALGLALILALAACSPWPRDATPTAAPTARPGGNAGTATPIVPRYGGSVTIGFVGALDDLTPAVAGNALASAIFRPVVEGLFTFDRAGQPRPWLAESVPVVGNGISGDGKVVILRLRQGVAWEDGRALTSEDVRFTRAVALDPANGLPEEVVAANRAIQTLDILDPYTVRLGYAGPDDSFLRAFPILFPAHLFNGQTTLAGHPYGRAPFGTGPFRFREWVPGDHLTLTRSGSYRDGGRPYLDEIVYRQFPDQPAAEAARRAGTIDLIIAADAASFVEPLPSRLHGLDPYAGIPTRSAQEWWKGR